MNKIEVRCPNCQTNFLIGSSGNPVSELSEGIHYLVPETVRNTNLSNDARAYVRMEALKAAGINVNKLQTLMEKDESLKDIFSSDDPIIKELSKGGFINNPELFRRWICAQTFRLLKDKYGWTHAVRNTYDIKYVLNQSKRELLLLCNLVKKCPNDVRLSFFTLDDLKSIFSELMNYNTWYSYRSDEDRKNAKIWQIKHSRTYIELLDTIRCIKWCFRHDCSFKPKAWLNCFKGAGAYYTLQNIIRTHGLILPDCKDMNESLKLVDKVYNSIIDYKPSERRWDILMSLLTKAVEVRKFELKY